MNIIEAIEQYEAIKVQEKTIASKKKELAVFIKQYAVEHGQQDSKGSSYKQEGGYTFGNVVSKSIKLNSEKALDYLAQHKPNLLDRVLDTVQIVSEVKLEELVAEGEISVDELEEMVDTKLTYSVNVKKEKAVEDEVVEVKTTPRVKKLILKKK